jgi:tetratricopeptide (TPR) repeat protein
MRGEIAYREGKHIEGLGLLRKAVEMQDNLNFDEPWGKMQPIRHALGGLLLEQGQITEAEDVFRKDLLLHPRNPWALVGLIGCLERKTNNNQCCTNSNDNESTLEEQMAEIALLKQQLSDQRKMEWADFNVVVACECCIHPT